MICLGFEVVCGGLWCGLWWFMVFCGGLWCLVLPFYKVSEWFVRVYTSLN